ncbi:1626_t:CDS:2 [Funneliformis caledonium]|uniref:1626_t:CDS:1 n=1 Tax=Funneliformis caledonium TaxID=1117310 RepID=A0A9N9EIX7_9GLOM|nr:1626_t:CDS:2 [Funneliformis caledonium]
MNEDNIKKRLLKWNQQETDLIIPLVLDIGIYDHITLDNISYVLVSVKNYQKSTDTNYFNNVISMNSLLNVEIEQLPTLLFLLLYMQFSANVSGVDKEYHFPQVGIIAQTTKLKIKKIQQRESSKQMQLLVYASEESAISSQSQSTLRVETNVHYGTAKSRSSLILASFNSIEQKLISNLKLKLCESLKKAEDALEVVRQWRVRQSKEKDDNLEKALKKIEILENVVT